MSAVSEGAVRDAVVSALAEHGTDHLSKVGGGWQVACSCGQVVASFADTAAASGGVFEALKSLREHVASEVLVRLRLAADSTSWPAP